MKDLILKLKKYSYKSISLPGTFLFHLKNSIQLSKRRRTFKGNFLDLGSGQGHILRPFSNKGFIKHVDFVDKYITPTNFPGNHSFKYYKMDILEFLNTRNSSIYDFILLSDILEHVEINKAKEIINRCNQLLSPEGIIFIKVPNGCSPFGLRNQNNDLTHIHSWGFKTLNEIVTDSKMSTVYLRPCFDNINLFSLFPYVLQRLIVQPFLNIMISVSIGNNKDFFWSPNLCLIAKKQ